MMCRAQPFPSVILQVPSIFDLYFYVKKFFFIISMLGDVAWHYPYAYAEGYNPRSNPSTNTEFDELAGF